MASLLVVDSVLLVSSALAFVTQLIPVAAGVQRIMHMALDVLLCVCLPCRGFHLHAGIRAELHVTWGLVYAPLCLGILALIFSFSTDCTR